MKKCYLRNLHSNLANPLGFGSKIGIFALLCTMMVLPFSANANVNRLTDNNSSVSATQQVVTGSVSEDSGMSLPGVSVVVKGTTNGTVTDIDGKFNITVADANSILVFSFVGMVTQEFKVGTQSVINVVMATDSEQMEEVVVTALGIKREVKKLGFSATEVKGEELASTNTVNPVLALQGKAAGLSITSSDGGLFGNSKIQIRGISVLNSDNNQPIFVIDGVILENSISNESADWADNSNDFGNQLKNLNPDDYESVTVLKGAASTALYGSRGMNGAVIIKTKEGKMRKGIGVSFSQSFGIEHVYAQPDIQYEFGEGAIAGYTDYGEKNADGSYKRFSTNQFYTSDGAPVSEGGIPSMINHPWAGISFGPAFDGRKIIGFDGKETTYSPIKDNMVDAYEDGFSSNTSIALNGGNEKGTFYLSDSYNKRSGIYPSNTFERNSLLFKGSYKLSNWLKAEASVSISNSTSKNPANNLSQNFVTGEWANWYDTKKYKQQQYYQAPHGGVPSNDYGDDYAYVPGRGTWFGYHNNSSESKEQVIRPTVKLTATVTDWLSVNVEANMNSYTKKYEYKSLGSGYTNEGGEYQLRHDIDESKTAKFSAIINKKINEDFTSSLIVGGELWEQEKSYTRVRTDGGLIIPGRYYLENSKKTLLGEGGISGTKQINSLYFLANFGYKDQVFLDITGRNDWSSALVYTDGTGNNSFFYPSVSAAWLFKETFELPEWITFGKLRMSWAQVGNDTDPYSINTGYDIGKYEVAGGGFIYNNSVSKTLVDKGINPEMKNSVEIGLDLRMFNNRVGIDVAYYTEKIKNQIGPIKLPIESGYENLLTNIGSLNNKGFELSLHVTPVKTRDFEWEATFNYWKNTTTVEDLHENFGAYKELGGAINYGNFRVGSVAYDGGEYGVLMSDSKPKEWKSADSKDPRNGKKMLNWSDGNRGAYYVRSGEIEKVGKIQPDFEGSLNNSFTYKGVSVSVLLDARFGGHMASYSNRYGTAYGRLETSLKGRDVAHGGIEWTSGFDGQTYEDGIIPDGIFAEGQMVTSPDGASVNVGGLSYREAYDKGYVEPTHATFNTYFNNSWSRGVINDDWFSEVNYIALRNISIAYQLPKSIAQKIGAQSCNVSLNARNLGYLYNSLPNHINPESFRGTGSSDSFRERSFSPYTASYTMSISLDF
jgi:iron complex outermembrane receptor protein